MSLLAIAALPLAARDASASVARAYSIDELTTAAQVVVRGRVLSSDSSGSQFGAIVTLTQIEVDDVLKGDAPAVLTLVEPGGLASDGSGVGLHVSGAARFEAGEEVLVFAEPPRGAYATNFPDAMRPVAMSQGKFRVIRETGVEPRATRDLSGVARVAPSPAVAVNGGSIQWAPVTFDGLEGLSLEQLSMLVRIHEIRLTPGCEGTLKIILAD